MSYLTDLTEQAAQLVAAPTENNRWALRALFSQIADEHNFLARRADSVNGAGLGASQMHYAAAGAWLRAALAADSGADLGAVYAALGASTAATSYTAPRSGLVTVLAGLLVLPFRLLGLA